MRNSLEDRLVLETDLKAALAAEEFFLEYQPTFNLVDMTTVGIEALLRWQHPNRGALSPLEFISESRRQRADLPVGTMDPFRSLPTVLSLPRRRTPAHRFRSTCRRVSWSRTHSSATSLMHSRRVDLPPGALVVEITESILMRDGEATIGRLKAIKSLGVRIAIDDFGTGYSSLAYLRRFPVDILKIDQSFISATGDDDCGDALLHTLVQLGKELCLETVAEGIEPRISSIAFNPALRHRPGLSHCQTDGCRRDDGVCPLIRPASAVTQIAVRWRRQHT